MSKNVTKKHFTNVHMLRLCGQLAHMLDGAHCDHTLKFTTSILKQIGAPEEDTLEWLESTGGCCDCEILMNSRAIWEDLPVMTPIPEADTWTVEQEIEDQKMRAEMEQMRSDEFAMDAAR